MDEIIARLKAELNAREMSQAKAARQAGLRDSQALRDVLAKRKRMSAELLAALAHSGIDTLYVLIGRRSIAPVGMAEKEIEAFNRMMNLFWSASDQTREIIATTLSGLHAQDVQRGTARGVRKPPTPKPAAPAKPKPTRKKRTGGT